MLTTQQLAEARAYERRRVVTAFVSGSVPESLAAPPSTGRALLAGLALAVLLGAGTVVAWVAGPSHDNGSASKETDPELMWRRIGDTNP